MAQTAQSIMDVLKQTWTSDLLIQQFENLAELVKEFETLDSTPIGSMASVAAHMGRAYAGTSVGAGGGNLNPARQQAVAQAQYSLVYLWHRIAIDHAAMAQSGNNAVAIVGAKDLEIKGALSEIRETLARQYATNGDGVVGACATNGSSSTIHLTPASAQGAAYGYDAIKKGWLGVGSIVDIGTLVDSDSLVADAVVTAVSDDPADPTITIGTAIATTAGTHFVSIANPNSGTTPNPEANGLRQIIAGSGAIGNLNPATAGREAWKAAKRDTATTVLSLELINGLHSACVKNGADRKSLEIWTSETQINKYYGLLQNQVRYNGNAGLAAGNVDETTYNGKTLKSFLDILESDLFVVDKASLGRVVASDAEGPQWSSDVAGGGMIRAANQTTYEDAIVWGVNLACKRRNTNAAATALSA